MWLIDLLARAAPAVHRVRQEAGISRVTTHEAIRTIHSVSLHMNNVEEIRKARNGQVKT